MENYVIENQLEVQALCYDPYAIHGVLAELERRGWQDELYEIRQGPQTLSNPISDFRLKIINGNIKHEKNPLLDIAVKNAVAKNVNDSLVIEKQMNREKIDPIWQQFSVTLSQVSTSGTLTRYYHCLYRRHYGTKQDIQRGLFRGHETHTG